MQAKLMAMRKSVPPSDKKGRKQVCPVPVIVFFLPLDSDNLCLARCKRKARSWKPSWLPATPRSWPRCVPQQGMDYGVFYQQTPAWVNILTP